MINNLIPRKSPDFLDNTFNLFIHVEWILSFYYGNKIALGLTMLILPQFINCFFLFPQQTLTLHFRRFVVFVKLHK